MEAEVLTQVEHADFYLDAIDLNGGNGETTPAKTISWRSTSNMIPVELTSSEFQLSEALREAEFSVSIKAQLANLLRDTATLKMTFPLSSSFWQTVIAKLLHSHFHGHVYL